MAVVNGRWLHATQVTEQQWESISAPRFLVGEVGWWLLGPRSRDRSAINDGIRQNSRRVSRTRLGDCAVQLRNPAVPSNACNMPQDFRTSIPAKPRRFFT